MIFSFEEAIHASNGLILVIAIVAIPICILATLLRIVGARRAGRKLALDDYFVIGALIGFMPYAISPIAAVVMAETMDDPLEFAQRALIMAYAVTPFFYINQLFARASLMILYHRLFWSDRVFLRGIYVLATIHVVWFIVFFFMEIFLCNPVSLWWDLTGEQEGWCIDGNAFLVAEEGINSSLDFAVLGIAVHVVQKVMTRNNVKTKLAFIFLIGGLSGVIGFIKIGLVYSADNNAGQENDVNAFWDILQMATSILCICAPMYRTMLPTDAIWHRLKSSTQYLVSRTRLPSTAGDSRGGGSKIYKKNSHNWLGGGRKRNQKHRGGHPASDNSSEAQQAFYIGRDEADLTWSQFDKAENIKLDVYKTRSRADSKAADKSLGADSFPNVGELV